MKIAIIQKCPSNINYERDFKIPNLEIFSLSSEKVARLLVRDIDLVGFNSEDYDWVILVGSEAVKHYTKVTAVSDHTGRTVEGKKGETNFIASISPAMMAFKPETKPVFEATVKSIHSIINGTNSGDITEGEYEPIQCPNRANEYIRWLLTQDNIKTFALDSETTALQARHGWMLGFSLSHKKHQGVYIDAECVDEEFPELLQQLLEKKECVLHNAKFDMHFFTYHLGINFMKAKQIHDTMIQHYLLDERQGTHGLKSLTMKYGTLGDYDAGLEEFKKEHCARYSLKNDEFNYGMIPWEIISLYAAKDTAATLELHEKFLPLIEANPRLRDCYYKLMLPALLFLTRMEARGIPISKPRLEAAKIILTSDLDKLKAELYTHKEIRELEAEQNSKFNPNSTPQLRKLLFDHVGLPPTGKLTGTGAISTDAEVLEELAKLHPIPKLIHDIRKSSKLINTYIDKLLLVIDTDNKVRTGFNLTSTTSGRLSSSGNFNVQQLPRDNPIIKGCVKAPPGYKIVAVDLTTAEVYYAAVLSGDRAMQQIFINMQLDPVKYPDFHSSIAHQVFKLTCSPAEVKKLHPALRQGAKAITFGILYGSGPAKVAESVNEALMEQNLPADCTVEDARGYIEAYFRSFPQLKRWINNCHTEIKQNGFIYNHFGRKRRLHNIRSVDKGTAAAEVRSGFNAVIQSVSSDHLLLGALEADLEILDKGLDAEIFALVHDSVVAKVREDQVAEYLEILIRCLEVNRGCSIPNHPVGVDVESEDGGSEDYASGKLLKKYPELAAL